MVTIEQMVEVLTWSEGKADTVAKVAKLLKEGVQTYWNLTGSTSAVLTQGKKPDPYDAQLNELILGLAQQWSQLPAGVRKDVVTSVVVERRGDVAGFFNNVLMQIATVYTMQVPVANLAIMLGRVLRNQKQILSELERIKNQLNSIQHRLDEMVMRDARAGVIHLYDAANVSSELVRNQMLQSANDVFARLISLNPTDTTTGTSGSIQNRALITLGYWGRHLSLGIQGETRYALLQIYKCTIDYPLEGFAVFPSGYFSKDYKAELDAAQANLNNAQRNLQQASNNFQWSEVERAAKIAAGVLTTIGSVVAAVATRNFGLIQVGNASAHYAGEQKRDPATESYLINAMGRYETMRQLQQRLADEVTAECQAKIQLLERIRVSDLTKYMVPPSML